jgi:hypothetical protein
MHRRLAKKCRTFVTNVHGLALELGWRRTKDAEQKTGKLQTGKLQTGKLQTGKLQTVEPETAEQKVAEQQTGNRESDCVLSLVRLGTWIGDRESNVL